MVVAALVVGVTLLGWLLVVLPPMDVFAVSIAVAISWCLWLDRGPRQRNSR